MFTWRLEVLVNFHPLDISAIMPKVFLWSWHCPRFLVDIISQESFEGRFPDGRREFDLFFLGLFQPHLVVHSLCKYVTTCYNYNPNCRWNLILLSPLFQVFNPLRCSCLQRQALSGWIGRTGSSSWVRNLAHPRSWSWWTMEASWCGNLPTWNKHV